MGGRRRRLAVATAAVIVGLGADIPAHAESGTAEGSGAGYDGISLESVRASNTGKGVRGVVSLPGLARRHTQSDAVSVIMSLDSGFADVCGRGGCERQLSYTVQSSPYFGAVRLERYGQRYEEVACRGLSEKWDYRGDTVTLFVPDRCLAKDAGMTRVKVSMTREGGVYGTAASGVLQRGKRGALAGDVDGDGTVDEITEALVSPDRYEVRVKTASGTLTATGPRDADAPWSGAEIFAALDINKDGRAEIIADPADGLGDGSQLHLFRVVDGELKIVRSRKRRPLTLRYAGAGMDIYRSLRCSAQTLSTWQLLEAKGAEHRRKYRLKVRDYRLVGDRAKAAPARTVRVRADTARYGNWSQGSCLTN